MPEAWDDQLRDGRSNRAGSVTRRTSIAPWIGVALLVASAAAAIYLAFGGWLTARRPAEEAPAAPAASVPAPLGTPSAVDLPPLDASDALVRQLVAQLSSHPRVAAWLATDNRIRNFTVV